ncbi:hypothetical protein BC832DRAFT_553668 [Gaertneriomyces semiglobifer]|nr:hypothetical protein BC832DRAFT_553668 [Gaertneriomyces semiglobifer]
MGATCSRAIFSRKSKKRNRSPNLSTEKVSEKLPTVSSVRAPVQPDSASEISLPATTGNFSIVKLPPDDTSSMMSKSQSERRHAGSMSSSDTPDSSMHAVHGFQSAPSDVISDKASWTSGLVSRLSLASNAAVRRLRIAGPARSVHEHRLEIPGSIHRRASMSHSSRRSVTSARSTKSATMIPRDTADQAIR